MVGQISIRKIALAFAKSLKNLSGQSYGINFFQPVSIRIGIRPPRGLSGVLLCTKAVACYLLRIGDSKYRIRYILSFTSTM